MQQFLSEKDLKWGRDGENKFEEIVRRMEALEEEVQFLKAENLKVHLCIIIIKNNNDKLTNSNNNILSFVETCLPNPLCNWVRRIIIRNLTPGPTVVPSMPLLKRLTLLIILVTV